MDATMEDLSTSSGFGDESPILNRRQVKKPASFKPRDLTLEGLYKLLSQYHRQGKYVSRKELKSYQEQAKKFIPIDMKSKWMLMKIHGLFGYILNRKSDFNKSIESGEITIFQKPSLSLSIGQEGATSLGMLPGLLTNDDFVIDKESSLLYQSQQTEASINVPSAPFNNRDFEMHETLMETCQNGISDDMFNDLSKMTNNWEEGFQKIVPNSDSLEQDANIPSLIKQIVNLSRTDDELVDDNRMSFSTCAEDGASLENIFDDLSITNDQFKEEFEQEYYLVEGWISDVVNTLPDLRLTENSSNLNSMENQKIDENIIVDTRWPPQSYHNQKNMKIIAEAIEEFDKDLKEAIKHDKDLQILHEFIDLLD